MTANILQSMIYGSTAQYTGDVYVHGNVEGETAIDDYCVAPSLVVRNVFPGNSARSMPNDENEGDVSGITGTAVCTSFHEYNESGVSGVIRCGNYIYYQDKSQANTTVVEYNLVTKAKVSIQVLAANKTIRIGIIDDRKVGVYLIDTGSYFYIYELDFSSETSSLLKTLTRQWDVGDFRYLSSTSFFSVIFMKYNSEIYVVAAHDCPQSDIGSAPYEDNGGLAWYVYNFDTDTLSEQIWQPHHDSRTTAYSGDNIYHPLVYYGSQVLCVPSDVDFDDGNDGTVFHTIDLSDLSTSVAFLASGAGWETQTYAAGVDYANGIAYIEVTWGNGSLDRTLITYNFSTGAVAIWKNNTSGYYICFGKTGIFFYDEDEYKWYDTNWSVVLTVSEPANGYASHDNLSITYSDTEQRIWWYDNTVSPKLVGHRVTDGNVREIAVSVLYPTQAPTVMGIFDLVDMFVLVVSENDDGNEEYFTVEAA